MKKCVCVYCGSDAQLGERCGSCGALSTTAIAEIYEVMIPDCDDPDAPYWIARDVEKSEWCGTAVWK